MVSTKPCSRAIWRVRSCNPIHLDNVGNNVQYSPVWFFTVKPSWRIKQTRTYRKVEVNRFGWRRWSFGYVFNSDSNTSEAVRRWTSDLVEKRVLKHHLEKNEPLSAIQFVNSRLQVRHDLRDDKCFTNLATIGAESECFCRLGVIEDKRPSQLKLVDS